MFLYLQFSSSEGPLINFLSIKFSSILVFLWCCTLYWNSDTTWWYIQFYQIQIGAFHGSWSSGCEERSMHDTEYLESTLHAIRHHQCWIGRFVCFHRAKDYTSCSVATGKVTQTGQASVEEPDKMYPIINRQEGLFRWVKLTPPRRRNSEIKCSPLGWGVSIRLPPWPYKNIYCWEASNKKMQWPKTGLSCNTSSSISSSSSGSSSSSNTTKPNHTYH
jgi:hypothetical protein